MILLAAALTMVTAATPQPTGPVLVVVNKPASTVSVVALTSGKILATLPTGNGPHEVAASADGRWAVVTDYGAQTPGSSLTVVDLRTLTVARTIPLPANPRPHGVWFLPDNVTVAISSEASQSVVLVDAARGAITRTVPTGQALSHMVVVTRDGKRGYTANITPGTLSAVDLETPGEPRVLKVGTMTEAINITPANDQAWLGSNNTGKVYVVDLARWQVIDSLQTSGFPYRIGFTPDGATAIVTNPQQDEVQVIDAKTRAKLSTMPVSGGPMGVAIAPDGSVAWITLAGAGEVAEIDLRTHAVRRRFAAGAGPDGIAYAVPAR